MNRMATNCNAAKIRTSLEGKAIVCVNSMCAYTAYTAVHKLQSVDFCTDASKTEVESFR